MKEEQRYSLMASAREEQYPRRRGRFKISELYSYLTPTSPYWIDPEHFFDTEERSDESIVRMQHGMMMHDYFSKLLQKDGWETNQQILKVVYPYKDIELVGIPDAIKENIVLEMKDRIEGEIKQNPAHDWQVRAYLTICDKEIGYIAQPTIEDDDIYLRLVKSVRRDDAWFHDICEKLVDYNKRIT